MRVLVSTSDKTGLLEFLKPLVEQGLDLVSTGGTFEFLKKNSFKVSEVSEVTSFPEVLDGRVKTLHPAIHMGLLANKNNSSHMKQLNEHQVKAFDMVVGNLYPFEKVALNSDSKFEDLVENIDIGGPSFLRASAKNFESVIVVCSPLDYSWVQEKILSKTLNSEDRKKLAIKVFSLTSYYDALIVDKLCSDKSELHYLNIPLKKKLPLRYGENSHQDASWYFNPIEPCNLADIEIHQGKELSYNNLLDLDAAINLVKLFEAPACVAVKHNNPCGVAIAENTVIAAHKTIESDPKSIFGGIVAFNRLVDIKTCEQFKDIFLECVVAPGFSEESLKYFSTKKNLRILSFNQLNKINYLKLSYKSISGGVLQQQEDFFENADWVFHGEKPNPKLMSDMIFGEKVAASLKSNAIAIVADGQTIGLGMGQVNRVDAVKQSLDRIDEFKKRKHIEMDQVILISDAFFPFPDSIDLIAEYGVKWILQPGGSVQDEKVFEAAKRKNINMVISHKRHFKH